MPVNYKFTKVAGLLLFWVLLFHVMTQSSITNYIFRHLNTIYIHNLINVKPRTYIMKVLSNDRYKSVLHRAVVNCDKERISIPTFYCPSPDAVIGPAPQLTDTDSSTHYRNFFYSEYYEKFWNRGLTTETCSDLFKTSQP